MHSTVLEFSKLAHGRLKRIKSLPREGLNLDPQQPHKERGVALSVLKTPVLERGVAEMRGH